MTHITATSISLSWSVPSGSMVTSSEVMWLVFSSGGGSGSASEAEDEGSETSGSITSTSYTIQELESGTNYSITVTVTNAAGSTVSYPFVIATSEKDSMLYIILQFLNNFIIQYHPVCVYNFTLNNFDFSHTEHTEFVFFPYCL